jgi:hypothetical protein
MTQVKVLHASTIDSRLHGKIGELIQRMPQGNGNEFITLKVEDRELLLINLEHSKEFEIINEGEAN